MANGDGVRGGGETGNRAPGDEANDNKATGNKVTGDGVRGDGVRGDVDADNRAPGDGAPGGGAPGGEAPGGEALGDEAPDEGAPVDGPLGDRAPRDRAPRDRATGDWTTGGGATGDAATGGGATFDSWTRISSIIPVAPCTASLELKNSLGSPTEDFDSKPALPYVAIPVPPAIKAGYGITGPPTRARAGMGGTRAGIFGRGFSDWRGSPPPSLLGWNIRRMLFDLLVLEFDLWLLVPCFSPESMGSVRASSLLLCNE